MYGYGGFGGHPTAALHDLTHESAVALMKYKNGRTRKQNKLTQKQMLTWSPAGSGIIPEDVGFKPSDMTIWLMYDENMIARLDPDGWVTLGSTTYDTQTTRSMYSCLRGVNVYKGRKYAEVWLSIDDSERRALRLVKNFRFNQRTGEVDTATLEEIARLDKRDAADAQAARDQGRRNAAAAIQMRTYGPACDAYAAIMAIDGFAWVENRVCELSNVPVFFNDEKAAREAIHDLIPHCVGQFRIVKIDGKTKSVYRLAVRGLWSPPLDTQVMPTFWQVWMCNELGVKPDKSYIKMFYAAGDVLRRMHDLAVHDGKSTNSISDFRDFVADTWLALFPTQTSWQ